MFYRKPDDVDFYLNEQHSVAFHKPELTLSV